MNNTPNNTDHNTNKHKGTLPQFPLSRGERIKVRVSHNVAFSRLLRKNQTDAERLLWFKLRNRQLDGFKFRRQERMGPFVVDFICFERKLIIEIDGGQHNEDDNIERDKTRTIWLRHEGYSVLRFWNNEVGLNLDGVLERIKGALTPALSPKGRGNI